MNRSTNFKDIINGFETFANNHSQLNGFGWGDISNINPDEHKFPMIWLHPMNSSGNQSLTTLRFDMYVLDVIEQDRSNLLDVMNNTMIYGNDAVSEFWDTDQGFSLNESKISLVPFEGKFDQLLGSWIFTIEIQMRTVHSQCATPVSHA